jgi:pre-mRNA-processing factor 17
MDLLDAYTSDDERPQCYIAQAHDCSSSALSASVTAAPVVLKGGVRSNELVSLSHSGLGIGGLLAKFQGPAHPYKQKLVDPASIASNPGVGQYEPVFVEDWAFDQQFQDFQRSGFAADSTSSAVFGDKRILQDEDGSSERANMDMIGRKKKKIDSSLKSLENFDCDVDDSDSPWTEQSKEKLTAPQIVAALSASSLVLTETKLEAIEGPTKKPPSNVHIVEPEEETEKWERVAEKKMGFVMPPRQQRGSEIAEASSTFHGQEQFDYQGRSWITPPSGVRRETEEHECFIPKKCIKKYTGHSKGVNDIHFFPFTGHLLLSSSNDGKCKIWDVYGDRNVRRTYAGHTEGVRCTQFSDNGLEFLSSSFDRVIRLWDVETGQAKGTFTNRKMGYDVKFRPGDNNIFLMAASDNKIYQWDSRTGNVCQEYNYHLQPCNTVTFFDKGRKFISTSDDKKILVWEFDIPVPIKYIADPDMHSVPAITVHPSGEYLAGQSMDNTIVVYTCGDKVKQVKKKTFTGHNNAGYACRIGFSPNGKLLISGDGQGKLHVWDWKSTKVVLAYMSFTV